MLSKSVLAPVLRTIGIELPTGIPSGVMATNVFVYRGERLHGDSRTCSHQRGEKSERQ